MPLKIAREVLPNFSYGMTEFFLEIEYFRIE